MPKASFVSRRAHWLEDEMATEPTLGHICQCHYQGPTMCLVLPSVKMSKGLLWRTCHLFLLSLTPPSFSPYLTVPGDYKTGMKADDPILLVVLPVMWAFGEEEKMCKNHTHLQFIYCFTTYHSKGFIYKSQFLNLVVGIIALLVQIKRDINVLNQTSCPCTI